MQRSHNNQATGSRLGFDGALDLLQQAGFRNLAYYQIIEDQLILRLSHASQEAFDWPAIIPMSAFLHYNANRENMLPVGWGKLQKNAGAKAGITKNIRFFFPDQRFAQHQLALALRSGDIGGRPSQELSLKLERLAHSLIHLMQLQQDSAQINERIFIEVRRQFGQDLANSLDHELRTPLSIISGYAQCLKGLSDQAEVDNSVQLILTQVMRAVTALDRLLVSLQHHEIGHVNVDQGDIIELLQELQRNGVAENTAAHWPELQLVFQRGHDFSIVADLNLLKASFVEVIANAARHGRAQTVQVTIYRKGDWIVVDFFDNGPGVRPGSEELIFLRYYQEDTLVKRQSMQSRNLGLGLFVARRIVEQIGGQLHYVRVDQGRGGFAFCYLQRA